MAINTSSMAKYNGIMSVRRSDKMLAESIFRENKKGGRKTVRKEKKEDIQKTGGRSVIMQETAQYGVGTKVIGKSIRTKEDMESVDRMERQFMKNTGYVRVDNRKK